MIALECARRLPKDTNILFLCFDKLIIQYLKDDFSAELPNVTFANLNQLYAKSGGNEYATTDEIIDFLLSTFNDNCQFEHIIVDEAQDFAADHLDFLAEIISGDVPCLNNYQNAEATIQGIADTIRFYTEKGFTKNQITILTLKTLEKTILKGYDSVGGYRLTNELNGTGILFTTARKFKGLESDVVIVIDFDEDVFKDDNAKNVFYVAASRAKHCLTFIASLDDATISKIITDLNFVPGSNPKSTLKNLLSIDFQDL